MKLLNLTLLMIILSLGLAACQKGSSSNRDKDVTHREMPPAPPVGEGGSGDSGGDGGMGGGDGAGGNGAENRSWESYSVKPLRDMEVFTEEIIPILYEIEEIYPEFAADLWHIVLNRKWRIVPVTLNLLPWKKTGVFSTDKKNQQIALQFTEEIWIDGGIYEQMTLKDQRDIVLHELVMGVRVLEFASGLDKCEADAMRYHSYLKANEDDKEFLRRKEKCHKKHERYSLAKELWANDTDVDVGKRDHQQVRVLTDMLLQDLDSIYQYEIETILDTKFKRRYGEQ